MTTPNNAVAESFAANPVLIDAAQIGVVNSGIQAFATEQGQLLLNARVDANEDFWNPHGSGAHPYRPYVVSGGILQIPVQGVLLNKFSFQFGRWATGYQYIEKALQRGLADSAVKGIALIVDSPGGEVAGCFELADKIFSARGEKPVRAYSSDHAYSAAYALASSASEVVVSRSGGTGSVGVVTMHVDMSEALAKAGVKVTFIFAGKHKVEGNAYAPLPDAVKSRIQDRIDRIYGTFTGTVARNRGIDEQSVRDSEALTYDASDSVANGFADRIGALDEELVAFMNDLATLKEGESMSITQEQLDAAVASARDEGFAAGRAEGLTAGVTTERERRSNIMGSDAAVDRPKAAAAMVERGLDAETAIGLLADLPTEKAEAPAPAASSAPKSTGSTPFDRHMQNSGNPEVGADAGQSNDDMDEDAKITAGIRSAAMAFKGRAA